jgi:tetratricopeptide (TPR) repeat protein
MVPYNGEYAFRAGRILGSGEDAAAAEQARAAFDAAIRANPLSAAYHATRAEFESHQPQPDPARVRNDFERCLAIDPENVQTRLAYAQVLEALHFAGDAREQYEKALWYNDQLADDEIERLSAAKVAAIRANIARLRQAVDTMPTTHPM